MENRIEIEKEIRESRNHEQYRHVIISFIGVVVPITVWILNYGKVESAVWWGFFTVVMILVSVYSFIYGAVKILKTAKAVTHYRNVLTMYSVIDERTHIPSNAIVTTCLRADMGRFGFQKINYYFWMDATELVFFPVRPEFLTSKAYHLVQSVRLNGVMVRSFALIGNQFDEGIRDGHENPDPIATLSYCVTADGPVCRDTRATLIAYAFGEQTIYLAFDAFLYERLNALIPDRERQSIEAGIKLEDPHPIELSEKPVPPIPES
ncbi:MAG: hypothetical protein A2Y16_05885 [Tenericutes bacterium GWF2_57_13]|nr:MAG: hypothetical protein A2Y16_05885 [Tenericutes bacterium GWF2_57_13]